MTEVATLGLQIDTRQVTQATTELNKLAPAARAAEAATSGLEAAAKRAGGAMPTLGAGAKKSTVDLSTLEKALQATTADINIHERALANGTSAHGKLAQAASVAAKQANGLSFEARNLSYQLVDVTQGALMGQSAFQIFAQQGGQVAQVIATSPAGLGGLTRELGRSLAALVTPGRLAIGILGGIGLAAYAMNAAWKSSTLAMDDTARATQTTIGQFRILNSAATVAGIEEFAKDSERLAAAIYQAQRGMGGLGDVLRANGERATDFVGTLESLSRILGRASSDQQKLQILQQAGLPATLAWVRYLSSGGDALKRAAGEAAGFNGQAQTMIDSARRFDVAWDSTWQSFKDSAYNAYTAAKGWLGELALLSARSRAYFNPPDANARTELGFGSLGNYQNPALANGLAAAASRARGDAPAVDPAAAARALAIESQRFGILGQTVSVGQAVRMVEIQIAQARLSGVSITAQEADKLKEIARQRALGTDQLRAQTDAYNADAATVGMSIERAASYAAVQERLNEARRNGQTLTAANIADLTREGDALGAAAKKADDARFQFDTFSGTFRDFASNLRQGQNSWESFGNAAQSALNKITDRLIDMASRQLWTAAFGGGGGGINIGSLLGIGGGGGPSMVVGGAGSMAVPTFAKGGAFRAGSLSAFSNSVVTQPTVFPINDGPIRAFANGTGLMGEAGPEAIMPLTRGSDGKLGVRSQGGAGGVEIHIHNAPPGTQTRETPKASGGTRIDVMLKRTVDDNTSTLIASGESSTNKALEQRYGLVPKL